MKLTDLFNPLTENYYDPNADQAFKQSADDKRKPALTLRAINRMKKIRSTRKLEDIKHLKLVSSMYSPAAGEDDMDGGF